MKSIIEKIGNNLKECITIFQITKIRNNNNRINIIYRIINTWI